MLDPTQLLVEVIRDAITSFFTTNPDHLARWGSGFDACLKETLRRAGQQALGVILQKNKQQQQSLTTSN